MSSNTWIPFLLIILFGFSIPFSSSSALPLDPLLEELSLNKSLPFPASSWYISPSLYNSLYHSRSKPSSSSTSTTTQRNYLSMAYTSPSVNKLPGPNIEKEKKVIDDSTTKHVFPPKIPSTIPSVLPINFRNFTTASLFYKWLIKEVVTRQDTKYAVKVLPPDKDVSILVPKGQKKR